MEPYIYNVYICEIRDNMIHLSIDCGFDIHINKTLKLYKIDPDINKIILKELKNKIMNKQLKIHVLKNVNYECVIYDKNENINEWIDNYNINLTKAIKEHGLYLGMILPEDNEFLWISKASLEQELPPYWIEDTNKDNRVFYSNTKTKQSIWEHPCDELYREMYKSEKNKLSINEIINLEDINIQVGEINTEEL